MPKWRNDGIRWRRKKHGASDNMHVRYHDEFWGGKEGMELMTPRLEMGSSDVRNTPIEIGFAQYA
jgi:hypothetical protein